MSASEERRWIPVRAAVAQIKCVLGGDDWSAQSVIASRLRDGVFIACADRIVSESLGEASELANKPVEVLSWVWAKSSQWQKDQQGWHWPTGDFTVTVGDDLMSKKYRMFGVRIDADQLDQLAPPPDATPKEAPNEANKGGRSADKHGEPIAALTLRLLAKNEAELARETAEALAPDLAQLYRDAGASSPSIPNLAGICYGILRVVRKHRQKGG